MRRQGGRLSPRKVATAQPKPGRRATLFPDGLNLYLQCTLAEDGEVRRSWVFRYQIDGRTRDMGLGATHTIGLAEARAKAKELRQALVDGIDPLERKLAQRAARRAEQAKALTFDEAAAQYISAHESAWRSETHLRQWQRSLARYASPVIGKLPVASIDLPLVLKILEPHWQTRRETMSRVRGRLESILGWCIVRGYRAGPNPAEWKGNLEHLLAGGGGAKVHMAAVPWAEIPDFMGRLRQREGDAARALEFVALTACRTGEVLGARWAEFDLDARIWTIPPDRMKANREHRIPLAQRVVEILQALPRKGDNVFGLPGPSSLLWQMRRLEPTGTVHGLRSSFRDWGAERTNYPREIAEAALAHAVSSEVERSYLRGSFWEKRVRLMDEWAKFCTSPPSEGEVVPLHRSAADA